MSTKTTIKCPNCQTEIDVNKILYHQFEEKLKQETQKKEKELQKSLDDLRAKEESIEEQRERFDEELQRATKEQVKREKLKLKNRLKKELQDEQSESMALLQKELKEKSEQVKELNKSRAEIEKLKREQYELEDKIKADAQKILNKKLQEEKQKIEQRLKEESEQKDRASGEAIDKIKRELEKAKKAEQELKKQTLLEQKRFEEEQKRVTKEQLKAEKERLRRELEEEQSESKAVLERELAQKSEQIKELNRTKAEIEKLKREQEELESKLKADAQIALEERLYEEKLKIQKILQEENELKLKAKDESLEQIKRELENARRKAEQGSMQTQGEALELVIESWLSSQFPFDTIDEVKKGAFGADCVQTIHTREVQNCGIICYESKNTKSWSDGWIAKLKQDMLKVNADLGVLVSSVYPKDMRRMGFVDGIWVCSLDEFKGSSALLRDTLIRVHQTAKKEENRSDKINRLYDYMTGNEFSMQLKSIVDGFMKMQEELDKEKRSLMASWKRRQKTIDGVLANTTEMYGALQGIAGDSVITHIDALELEAPSTTH
jgi:hypothetical protein